LQFGNPLDADIEYLKGVGPVRAELLKSELGFYKARDLVFDFPARHVDRSSFTKISQVTEEGTYVQIIGQLIHVELLSSGKARRLRGVFKDESGTAEFVWFKNIRTLQQFLQINGTYIAYGRATFFHHKLNFAHPELELLSEEALSSAEQSVRIFPIYRSTEKLNQRGLDGKVRRRIMAQLLEKLQPAHLPEPLPEYLVERMKFFSAYETIRQIHFPDNQEKLLKAEKRLKFEEFFFHQLKILHSQQIRKQVIKGYSFKSIGEHFNGFYNEYLPFELTGAQKRVLKEIRKDLGLGIQMNRLLQGDVGSGKTIVALLCMLMALDNGFQSCLVAPTEILATQHYIGLSELLKDTPVTVGFLSGSIKGKARAAILASLASGELHILIGTHAVLEDPVVFHRLGLAITDEQHRFGVAQRARLWKKSEPFPPHILVMTATPIPRTLAMTLYGDLDISVIDELPPGRQAIQTTYKSEIYRGEVIEFMKKQIEEGRQIYVVYPLIEESEKLDLENLQQGYEKLQVHFPAPDFQISVVHGRMKSADKDWEMKRFVEGTSQIMVATTVIEVGVNVPNASVMVIENSERFGLSQLHQLRGRVGRGASQSYCILMTNFKLTEDARLRLDTMRRTNNGFEIAEVDLEIRGPGALDGTQQSGIPEFKIANLAKDGRILQFAREVVLSILDKDPELNLPEHRPLKIAVSKDLKEAEKWSNIS
jgi:ATP-dependent DNA helicase RecG